MANFKTNVMRILETNKIDYNLYTYESGGDFDGCSVASKIGKDANCVFKTLVTESDKKEHFVFVIPVAETLDLKAAARVVGVKALSMLKQKELLPLTGYIHGGCSPVGMKKQFVTVFHNSAEALDEFYVSAGKVGRQIKVNPKKLCEFIKGSFGNIIV